MTQLLKKEAEYQRERRGEEDSAQLAQLCEEAVAMIEWLTKERA